MYTISCSYEWFGFPTPCKFFVVAVKHGTSPLFVVLRALPLLAYRFPLLHLPRLQSHYCSECRETLYVKYGSFENY